MYVIYLTLTLNLLPSARIFRQVACDLLVAFSPEFVHPLEFLLMCVYVCMLRLQQLIYTCVNDAGSDASACATRPSIQWRLNVDWPSVLDVLLLFLYPKSDMICNKNNNNMYNYYLESRSRGISYMKQANGRRTGLVTFCVETSFYNGLLKER